MQEWNYLPFTIPRPEISLRYDHRNRDELELIVAQQVTDLLAYYGKLEKYTLLRTADMGTVEIYNVIGVATNPIPLCDDDTLRLCQVPMLFDKEDTTPGLHCIERHYDADDSVTELSVWDPHISAEYRIVDNNGRRPSLDYLKELHAGMIALEFLYAMNGVEPNSEPLYTPAYPIHPLTPELALMQEQFD